MVRRYVVKYMPVKNGIILSTRDGFASVFTIFMADLLVSLHKTDGKVLFC